MSSVHRIRDDIAVVGWACRLPGANSIPALWSMLLEGRCAVSRVPPDRFSLERYGHPSRQERGKSYSWSAGIIDDLWNFDATVFGISPREAEQMDPQQRILLQLTWEALEDAGIKPSSLAKSSVGVYVGASQTDYGHLFFSDPAIADAHFATGTALSILANRISYIYDLHGPSVTIDTACSSSLVALHEAVAALQSGRIDTAIVAGTNVIASPASFIAFSQANMLSPTGLSRPFSAEADGFVRGEGAIVLVLRQASHALTARNPTHGYVLASDVNSDGRTAGISLPSIEAQEDLLRRVYSRAGIDPDRLAFIEAHGTGTPIGDPVEATAIGQSIGMRRSGTLPIGSIKSNIGHLEPASGLAGLLKALLALNHGILPPSLHVIEPNPRIDFARLNLAICKEPLLLAHEEQRIAGVNSFGFGGTNAHAIVAAGRHETVVASRQEPRNSGIFMFSAESDSALMALAQNYADRVTNSSDEEMAQLAAAVVHRREHLSKRVVVSSVRRRDVARALDSFIAGATDPLLESAVALGRNRPVAFVYSGNGSQWVGMGVSAYRDNASFRAQFDRVDSHFQEFANWSLKDALFSDDLFGDEVTDRLKYTSVAQPLIFAIQSASTAALEEAGLRPAAVLGHSVGEVAAAEAAKILDLATAVKVIHFRSAHQESVRSEGRMAAVLAPLETVQELARAVGRIEIAAVNSSRAVTIAGPVAALTEFKSLAELRHIALLDLDLDYPFHTSLMEPIRSKLATDLRNVTARSAEIPFISTVTGEVLAGSELKGAYWWRNVREPVLFARAVKMAAKLGARFFVEIGPRATLQKHIAESLQGEANDVSVLSVLDRNDANSDVDPFAIARSKALARGAQVNVEAIVGGNPGPAVLLPNYPWQPQVYRFKPTVEAVTAEIAQHPFSGSRLVADGVEWRGHIDTRVHPLLADHKVGEQVIFPGAGFLEIALSVVSQWLQGGRVALTNFEVLSPLDLTNGATREILTRVSPGSNSFEIFSRLRLSKTSWTLHSRGKFLTGEVADAIPPILPAFGGKPLGSDAIYHIAETSGLHYGPAFRLVQDARLYPRDVLDVRLTPPESSAQSPFELDPIRLDSGSHGVFHVFPELRYEERGVTYIPVRIDEVTLYQPNACPVRAVNEIVSKSERSIVVNIHLYDDQDRVVARLRNIRNVAVNARRASRVETFAVVETPEILDGALIGLSGVDVDANEVINCAKGLDLLAGEQSRKPEALLMLDAWAMAAAYEVASALATRQSIDLDVLAATGRLPEQFRPWLSNILMNLESAELATSYGGSWSLTDDAGLPRSDEVIKALAAEHPALAAELALAGAVSGLVQQIASSRAISAEFAISKTALSFFRAAHSGVNDASEALDCILAESRDLWPKNRALRVLNVGYSPALPKMLTWIGGENASITLFEPDQGQYERARAAVGHTHQVKVLNAEQVAELGTYDVIVSAAGLHRLPANMSLVDINRLLAPAGLLLAVEPQPSLFMDLVFGLDQNWFQPSRDWRPISPIQTGKDWEASAKHAGLSNVEVRQLKCRSDLPSLLVAKKSPATGAAAGDGERKSIRLLGTAPQAVLAEALVEVLRANPLASIVQAGSDQPEPKSDIVVLFSPAMSANADPVEALTQRCMLIKSCAEAIEGRTTLWLLFSGALAAGAAPLRPVETGAWAFSRTLANELQNLDVRRLDLSPDLPVEQAADLIGSIILSGTAETELRFDGSTIHAVRADRLAHVIEKAAGTHKAPAKLERRAVAGQRVSWQPMKRQTPQPHEVEIEVKASGVNFRDLMWAIGLLPDDVLEDGFTGPALGIECAGAISRLGTSVKGLAVGDRVMAFAGSSLATHVTVPEKHAIKIPDRMSSEAAATIPVAFFTSYYSLVTLAALKRREWVLIHGGAGAVGLAAIQIALSRGARVIATAGSPAKRGLLKALGVHHVFDSRSTAFVDEVRNVTGGGVHVVLNSLFGEAMERSIACLRPFGRFIELGKRDYVANTHVGLRPFRKNLSYFGVDVDQLIAGREALGHRVYARMMREFERGTLVPLPYSVTDVTEAFQLMQQSAHIGKLMVRPPTAIPRGASGNRFTVDAKGTHVVTGAFGGFGLETVKWLIERGARHLVLIGRRGAATPEAQAVLLTPGVTILAEPCDVSNLAALAQLFDKARKSMPPVVGVIHAAMVLDDAIVSNLNADRFRRVLAPKIKGAENLEAVTRDQPLDYFVMFSSVTTLLGNPGQGNYVAANAYMEGMARRRRQAGLPALTIGWGPISDVGVVAENERLQAGLQELTGVTGLRAREGLEFMVQALEQSANQVDLAVVTISPYEGSLGGGRLAVLRSPTYERLIGQDNGFSEAESGRIDLHVLAASEGVEAVRRVVGNVLVSKLAHVLHAREEDISRVRPLGEIGLDSLMALELAMVLEKTFAVHVPLIGASGAKSVADIADEITNYVCAEYDRDEEFIAAVAEHHHKAIEAGQAEALKVLASETPKTKRVLS